MDSSSRGHDPKVGAGIKHGPHTYFEAPMPKEKPSEDIGPAQGPPPGTNTTGSPTPPPPPPVNATKRLDPVKKAHRGMDIATGNITEEDL